MKIGPLPTKDTTGFCPALQLSLDSELNQRPASRFWCWIGKGADDAAVIPRTAATFCATTDFDAVATRSNEQQNHGRHASIGSNLVADQYNSSKAFRAALLDHSRPSKTELPQKWLVNQHPLAAEKDHNPKQREKGQRHGSALLLPTFAKQEEKCESTRREVKKSRRVQYLNKNAFRSTLTLQVRLPPSTGESSSASRSNGK